MVRPAESDRSDSPTSPAIQAVSFFSFGRDVGSMRYQRGDAADEVPEYRPRDDDAMLETLREMARASPPDLWSNCRVVDLPSLMALRHTVKAFQHAAPMPALTEPAEWDKVGVHALDDAQGLHPGLVKALEQFRSDWGDHCPSSFTIRVAPMPAAISTFLDILADHGAVRSDFDCNVHFFIERFCRDLLAKCTKSIGDDMCAWSESFDHSRWSASTTSFEVEEVSVPEVGLTEARRASEVFHSLVPPGRCVAQRAGRTSGSPNVFPMTTSARPSPTTTRSQR